MPTLHRIMRFGHGCICHNGFIKYVLTTVANVTKGIRSADTCIHRLLTVDGVLN